MRPHSKRASHPRDHERVHLWLRDSTNTYAAKMVWQDFNTVIEFFDAIKDAFLAQNSANTIQIEDKGEILQIKLLVWNVGAGPSPIVKGPLSARTTDPIFARFSNNLMMGYQNHRQQNYGERLLCLVTVLFDADQA